MTFCARATRGLRRMGREWPGAIPRGELRASLEGSIMWPFDVCMASIDHANLEKVEHPRFLTNRSFRDRNIEVLYFSVVK